MSIRGTAGIVVGIEGTVASEDALEWAIREAALRGCPVTVVHAWDFVPARDAGRMTEHEEKTASECMLDAEVACAIRKVGESPEVLKQSVKGSAARVLLTAAEGAELLVLGRGHRSGVFDVIRNSVSAECVRRATCPVVVIPTMPVNVHEHAHPAGAAAGVAGG
jgi:nucleotide-binding universal stress UspA family protein